MASPSIFWPALGQTILDFDLGWRLRAALRVLDVCAVRRDESDLGAVLEEKADAPLIRFQHDRGTLPFASKLDEQSSARKGRSSDFLLVETPGQFAGPEVGARLP